jgi:hypothetical protein
MNKGEGRSHTIYHFALWNIISLLADMCFKLQGIWSKEGDCFYYIFSIPGCVSLMFKH